MDILIDHKENMAKIIIRGMKDRPGLAAYLFTILGNKGFNVEMISQGGISNGRTDLSFVIIEEQADDVVNFLKERLSEIDAVDVEQEKDLAMIIIMGDKLVKTAGVAGKILKGLADRNINIELISTSFTTMSVLVSKGKIEEALDSINKKIAEIL